MSPSSTSSVDHQPVPLVDLGIQHEPIMDEVLEEIAAVARRGDFILGAAVSALEAELAEHHDVAHAVGVANGTDALELAMRALGIGRGDEVILPANTFIATAEAVVRAGAEPVLVDCDPDHLLIDPNAVPAAVTPSTRAVIAVHLYGQVAPVEALRDAVGDLSIVEDAAQAQGARRLDRSAMALGDVAATSFYPGKNLGAWGDAGAVLTDRDDVDASLRALRDHGSTRKYHHDVVGTNSRLDTIQAVVLRAKLRHLEGWNEERREAALRYDELLAGIDDVILPATMPGNVHVWHLYAVRVPASKRDDVLRSLSDVGIGVGVHYPVPVHLHGAFADLGLGRGAFPVAEAAGDQLLSLPLFPGITEGQQAWVAASLEAALQR